MWVNWDCCVLATARFHSRHAIHIGALSTANPSGEIMGREGFPCCYGMGFLEDALHYPPHPAPTQPPFLSPPEAHIPRVATGARGHP